MRGYFISDTEMENLRERLRLAYLETCLRHGARPDTSSFAPDSKEGALDSLFRTFNFHFVRWRQEIGENPHNSAPDLRQDIEDRFNKLVELADGLRHNRDRGGPGGEARVREDAEG